MSTDETLRNESPFVRVGTTLYKIVNQPRLNGGYVKKRIVWNNETLRQDYGKDYLANVPKYDGFCTVPDHVNYRQVIDNFLFSPLITALFFVLFFLQKMLTLFYSSY